MCNVTLNIFTGYTADMDQCRVDVMLIVDNSTRMRGDSSAITNIVNNIVSGLQLSENKTRVGVIAFNETYQWVVR